MNDISKCTQSATLDLLKKIEQEMFRGPLIDQFVFVLERVCSKRFNKTFPGPYAKGANVVIGPATFSGIAAMIGDDGGNNTD